MSKTLESKFLRPKGVSYSSEWAIPKSRFLGPARRRQATSALEMTIPKGVISKGKFARAQRTL